MEKSIEIIKELNTCLCDALEYAKEEFDVKEWDFQRVSAENIVVQASEANLLDVDQAIHTWANEHGVNLVVIEEGDALGTDAAPVNVDNMVFSTTMVTAEQEKLLNTSDTVVYLKRIDKIQAAAPNQYYRLLNFMNNQTVTLGDGVAHFLKNILFTVATVSDSIDSYNWMALLTYDGKDGFYRIVK